MPIAELLYKPGKTDIEGNEVKNLAIQVRAFDVQGGALILAGLEGSLFIIPFTELEAAAIHPDTEEENATDSGDGDGDAKLYIPNFGGSGGDPEGPAS